MVDLKFTFDAIGTYWEINIYQSLDDKGLSALKEQVLNRIETFDAKYSRFRMDSWVTQISKRPGEHQIPADGKFLFALYKELYHHSNGKFTPLIGQTLIEAGYDAQYSLTPKPLTKVKTWGKTLDLKKNKLILQQPAVLDFGAAGKGYLIDLVGELLQKAGVLSFCIDAGGDMLYRNSSTLPLQVGLEHPEHLDEVIGVVTLGNQSIAASAGNRRKWGNFHHIVDPDTLSSPKQILSVWVIASTTILADALSTCLFLASPSQFTPHYNFEYAILYSDYSLKISTNFPVKLFPQA